LKGRIEPLEERVQGEGVPVWGYSFPDVSLGTAPGSRRRAVAWITLPRMPGSIEAAYLAVGVVAERGERFPVSWKLAVDGVNVAREFKPQLTVETDFGVYGRAIYDVKPLLSRRLAERDDHKIFLARDIYRPVRVVDVFLYARYRVDGARYASSYYTGAAGLEPGEMLNLYFDIGRSFEGRRTATVLLHLPSYQAKARIVAGGSEPLIVSGGNGQLASISIPYKGTPIPLSIVYERPTTIFYPKTMIVSDVIVSEILYPEPRPRLEVDEVKATGEIITVRGRIINEGEGDLLGALLVAIAVGASSPGLGLRGYHRESLGSSR